MEQLSSNDIRFVLSRTPKDVRTLMQEHGVILAGGFIRATIAGEKASDIDLFGASKEVLENCANKICAERKGSIHKTDNAITVLSYPRLPVQFITRWLMTTAKEVICSFDFTVCQAAVYWEKDSANPKEGCWCSVVDEDFYPDLAAKRLTYTLPQRNEDAGGSMLRVRKYLSRGYNVQAESLGQVIARLVSKIEPEKLRDKDEEFISLVIIGLLREVDPLAMIDGLEPVNEHEVI